VGGIVLNDEKSLEPGAGGIWLAVSGSVCWL
jgi:hypothetical protein